MAKQKKVKIGDTEYTLQHPGIRARLQILDDCTNSNGSLNKLQYSEALFEHIVVQPKVKIEDFDEKPEEFDKLLREADFFLNPSRKQR